eukprot:GGOE01002364.1.p1 GENE.GGOE01002364.1~~GGOE01002364.1.p1  ORF type:complete len:496 (-),score=136.46 GGOE01002364.1:243-1709(-)
MDDGDKTPCDGDKAPCEAPTLEAAPSGAPWWFRNPFVGKPPPLDDKQWKVLTIIGALMFFDKYDSLLFTLVLTQIHETFGFDVGQQDAMIALVRCGSVLSLVFTYLADLRGRRIMLLTCMLLFSIFTCAIGLAPNIWWLLALQFLARCAADGLVFLSAVMVVEEVPEQHRGWAIGCLIFTGSLGQGVALALFSGVNLFPQGWRMMYIIGVLPLTLFFWARRVLPESRRFIVASHGESGLFGWDAFCAALRKWWAPFVEYPSRICILLLVMFFLPFNSAAASTLEPTYLQADRKFKPFMYTIMALLTGIVAISFSAPCGRLSDKFGRRPMAALGITGGTVGMIGVFVMPNFYLIFVAHFVMVSFGVMTNVMVSTLSAELFPTSYRSTASGLVNAVNVAAIPLGMMAHSSLSTFLESWFGPDSFWNQWTAVAICASFNFILPFLLLLLPATGATNAVDNDWATAEVMSSESAWEGNESFPSPDGLLADVV